MDFSIIEKYFGKDLDAVQLERYEALGRLYADWNSKINVISRRDIENLYLHHVLHSLAIARFLGPVEDGTSFLDMGTGGGFPGIPLAVMYPRCKFHLIDRIAKKLRVASDIAAQTGLDNVSVQHGDIGECHERFDYVVSRAVMRLDSLIPLIRKNIGAESRNKYANGLICLKGGDLTEEVRNTPFPVYQYPIAEFFNEEFFDTKLLVYVPLAKPRK